VLRHESQRVEGFHGLILIKSAQKVLLKFPLIQLNLAKFTVLNIFKVK